MVGRTANIFSYIFLVFFLFGCGYTKVSMTNFGNPSKTIQYPEPFEVVFKSGNNEFNSVKGIIKKDLVLDGFAEAPFFLSDDDKFKIYEIVKDVDWTTLPGNNGMISVLGANKLWIRFGHVEKNISWNSMGNNQKNENERLLMELEIILKDILYNNPAYRSFPKPRGARL